MLVPARVGARSPHSLALVRVHGAALVPVLSTLGSIALVLLFTDVKLDRVAFKGAQHYLVI